MSFTFEDERDYDRREEAIAEAKDRHRVTTISVRDWTETPGGRYRRHGPFSGEAFREEVLLPALKRGPAEVDLGWVAGYGTGWLEEVFGGAIRADQSSAELIEVMSTDPDDDYFVRFAQKAMKSAALKAERDEHAAERTRLAMLRGVDRAEIARLRELLRALVEDDNGSDA